MSQVIDEAVFDVLYLLQCSEKNFSSELTIEELCAFLYLSCLVGVVDKTPYSNWGYEFYLADGEVTSTSILDAVNYLRRRGLIEGTNERSRNLSLTDNGRRFLGLITGNAKYHMRTQYLSYSSDTTLFSPIEFILRGIYGNPELENSTTKSSARAVLGSSARKRIYRSLLNICARVGLDEDDKLIATLSWITYNNKKLDEFHHAG
ncbi:hypothetical protein [Idiomarina ramblicola]|uniref:Uncharacterized protein n=1 Tax=Idiomarina ramblicola TaxID=263724 RepID=A0A432Z0H7_9GAMM|nr:hypothetical protein [Idiomarina ramblicola]RUO69693.1 hypothetical protein CWI78_07140 [Idiomarina ramblicola]